MTTKKELSIKVLLAGSFLSTFGVFIAVPLVGLHAVQFFHLSPSEIGILASVWPLTVFGMSFFAGMYSDQWGHLRVIRLAQSLFLLGFMLMALAPKIYLFALGLFFFGLGKAFFDSSIRAAFTCVSLASEREKYFRLRYLVQNVASMLGPLVGMWAYKNMGALSFSLTSVCSFLFILLTLIFLHEKDFLLARKESKVSLASSLTVFRDNKFVRWVLSGVTILIAYGAMEALMPSIIVASKGTRPDYGFLVSLNAATVIVFQSFFLSFFKKTSLLVSLLLGTFLMVVGFQCFTLENHIYFTTLLATVLYSAGESLLFPCFEVLMDKIASRDRKALYFGAGEIKQVGFFIGPMLGGILLQHTGANALFVACSLCAGVSGFLLFSVRESATQNQSEIVLAI